MQSPSLRGSGLKSFVLFLPQNGQTVSLFTREWIEMYLKWDTRQWMRVSLFTREWIEIDCRCSLLFLRFWSPSLRGSGLKYLVAAVKQSIQRQSPSLRGSGLKSHPLSFLSVRIIVSLFTREWIEIASLLRRLTAATSLPLYEGVD